MRTMFIVLACAACGSSKETPGTASDDEPVTEPAGMTAGRKAPSTETGNTENEPRPGGGSGGARAEETPRAGSASQPAAEGGAPAPAIEKATEFDAGDDPERNKVTAAQLCERLATINCAGEAFCCDAPNRTVEACKQDLIM
ncbi:MAG TPA: hypothetical protein VMF89_28875, partial [Polyangiales bacterium]|nr:hypothetical protein [Polyangiales bacterium]